MSIKINYEWISHRYHDSIKISKVQIKYVIKTYNNSGETGQNLQKNCPPQACIRRTCWNELPAFFGQAKNLIYRIFENVSFFKTNKKTYKTYTDLKKLIRLEFLPLDQST